MGIYQAGKVEEIILLFDKSCVTIKNRVFVNNQEIEETEEGIIFKAKFKISNEFISWVLGWGKKCKVIKPESLKSEIVNTAKDILDVYSLSKKTIKVKN